MNLATRTRYKTFALASAIVSIGGWAAAGTAPCAPESVCVRNGTSLKKRRPVPVSSKAVAVAHDKKVASLLVDAVAHNNLTAAKALLSRGADPNSRNAMGSPVLVVALNRGYLPLAQELLQSKANPNARGRDGTTALLEAVINNRTSIIPRLIAAGANLDASYDASVLKGTTALMLAAGDGHRALVNLLLDAGADVNAKNNLGDTALHIAAGDGQVAIAALLLQKGAPVDCRDWIGITPLMTAMQAPKERRTEMVRLLIGKGADVNARDDANRRLVLQADFVDDQATVKKLSDSDRLKTLHEDGTSVLNHAGEDKQIIALLKQAGAKR